MPGGRRKLLACRCAEGYCVKDIACTAVSPVLDPEATIGILGGGQLGRMLVLAAARLGFKCHVFAPIPILLPLMSSIA